MVVSHADITGGMVIVQLLYYSIQSEKKKKRAQTDVQTDTGKFLKQELPTLLTISCDLQCSIIEKSSVEVVETENASSITCMTTL